VKGVFALTVFSTGRSHVLKGDGDKHAVRKQEGKEYSLGLYISSLNSGGRRERGKIRFQVATERFRPTTHNDILSGSFIARAAIGFFPDIFPRIKIAFPIANVARFYN